MILYAHSLHHICIFTMFHVFRCVFYMLKSCMFYMLKSCVLVGLDWAELMMLILLHVTFSCIFHAYIPFFSYFDIDVVWYSSACLSLFLFLSDSLRMVPQRKTTPSQNLLHSKASSSSDSTPLHVKFRDDKAHQNF